MALAVKRRTELVEKSVFGWSDTWLGYYVVTDVGDAHVSFERFDPHAGRSGGRIYTLPRGEMERLLEAGRARLLEHGDDEEALGIEVGKTV